MKHPAGGLQRGRGLGRHRNPTALPWLQGPRAGGERFRAGSFDAMPLAKSKKTKLYPWVGNEPAGILGVNNRGPHILEESKLMIKTCCVFFVTVSHPLFGLVSFILTKSPKPYVLGSKLP